MSNLVWHDEQDVSWTYCGRFKLYLWGTNYPPYRSTQRGDVRLWRSRINTLGHYSEYVGTFPTIEIAKAIAEIITDAEQYSHRKPKELPESKTLTYEQLIELESKYPPLAGGR